LATLTDAIETYERQRWPEGKFRVEPSRIAYMNLSRRVIPQGAPATSARRQGVVSLLFSAGL
jgi:hypothetical protein